MAKPIDIQDKFQAVLADYQVTPAEFQSAANRLYASGVVALNYTDTEDADYRTCRHIEELLKVYFSLAGWTFLADRDGLEYRLYPPGALVPGEEDTEQGCQMRLALPREAARIALACHLLYDQALRSGDLDEVSREAMVRLEDIATVLSSRLGSGLPKSVSECQRLLDALRQCRYLRFSGEVEPTGVAATIIGIRPALYRATTRLAEAWLMNPDNQVAEPVNAEVASAECAPVEEPSAAEAAPVELEESVTTAAADVLDFSEPVTSSSY